MDWESKFSVAGRQHRWRTLIAASHHVTLLLGRMFPQTVPIVLVTGHPKSGTSWVSQLVADYLQLPLPRLSILPLGCAAVLHGHQLPSPRLAGAVYVIRDGRDVMVSFYFAIVKDIVSLGLVPRRYRYLFPDGKPDNVRDDLPHFIDAIMQRPLASRLNWPQHIARFHNANITRAPVVRYEQLLSRGTEEFSRAMEILTGKKPQCGRVSETLSKFSFQRQSCVNPSDTNRRRGVPGNWKDHFTRLAAERFDHYGGKMLVKLKYEPDSTWVKQIH
jgi:hypothetical protein